MEMRDTEAICRDCGCIHEKGGYMFRVSFTSKPKQVTWFQNDENNALPKI
jgi:hypothetical protein